MDQQYPTKDRLAICQKCPSYLLGVCRKCGCLVKFKVLVFESTCPLKKW